MTQFQNFWTDSQKEWEWGIAGNAKNAELVHCIREIDRQRGIERKKETEGDSKIESLRERE